MTGTATSPLWELRHHAPIGAWPQPERHLAPCRIGGPVCRLILPAGFPVHRPSLVRPGVVRPGLINPGRLDHPAAQFGLSNPEGLPMFGAGA